MPTAPSVELRRHRVTETGFLPTCFWRIDYSRMLKEVASGVMDDARIRDTEAGERKRDVGRMRISRPCLRRTEAPVEEY